MPLTVKIGEAKTRLWLKPAKRVIIARRHKPVERLSPSPR